MAKKQKNQSKSVPPKKTSKSESKTTAISSSKEKSVSKKVAGSGGLKTLVKRALDKASSKLGNSKSVATSKKTIPEKVDRSKSDRPKVDVKSRNSKDNLVGKGAQKGAQTTAAPIDKSTTKTAPGQKIDKNSKPGRDSREIAKDLGLKEPVRNKSDQKIDPMMKSTANSAKSKSNSKSDTKSGANSTASGATLGASKSTSKMEEKLKPSSKSNSKESKVDPKPEKESLAAMASEEISSDEGVEPEDVVLTDAEGRRYCKVKECDQLSTVEGYCRFHYLLLWKKIQNRKKILADGKLERYIEELTSRYPDKYIEMIRKDLRTEKDFSSAISEMELDDANIEGEFEEEAQSLIDEVRGIGGASSRGSGSGGGEDEF